MPPCMKSGKLAVRGRTRKYLALQYTKILQSSAKSRIRPGTMGKMGQTNHKVISKGRPGRLYGRGTNPCVTCWKDPYIGPERGKLREVNPVSAINTDEEKSGKRRAEARGNSAPLPYMAHSPPHTQSGSSRVPGHWEAKSRAVPGRHTASWANEPQDKGFNYYYYYSPNLNKNSTPSIILNISVVSSCITDRGVSITVVSCGIIDRRISATALLDSSQDFRLNLDVSRIIMTSKQKHCTHVRCVETNEVA